jgi:hypothetical protein
MCVFPVSNLVSTPRTSSCPGTGLIHADLLQASSIYANLFYDILPSSFQLILFGSLFFSFYFFGPLIPSWLIYSVLTVLLQSSFVSVIVISLLIFLSSQYLLFYILDPRPCTFSATLLFASNSLSVA